MLNAQEIERFRRQLLLPELGEEGQLKLKKARVLVIGAGGLGNVVCAYLAAAGVGKITIVDHDLVELSNLQRQVMFTQEDIGLFKSTQLVKRLKALNSLSSFHAKEERFTINNGAELSKNQDVIVDCVDQISVRYLLNDVSVFRKIPWVYGAIHRFEGQVAVFNYQGSGTYRCAFPENTSMDKAPSCVEAGVIGVLPGLIGLYEAMEVIKICTGMGKVLANQLLMIDLLNTSQSKMRFTRKEEAIQIAEKRITNWEIKAQELNQRLISYTELPGFLEDFPQTQIIDLQEELSRTHWGTIEVHHIPDYYFQDQIQTFDRHQTILVYCQKGVKSHWAIQLMEVLGFKDMYELSGGIASVLDKNNG